MGLAILWFIEQADLFTISVEFETCMQSGVGGIVVGPNQKIAPGSDCRFGRAITWNLPLSRRRWIIRQVHAADIDCVNAVVVNLDPVVVLSLRILNRSIVGRHELVYDQRNFCCVSRADHIWYPH